MNWLNLNEESDLENIIQSDNTIAIFKHSTRCPVSSLAKGRIEKKWDEVGIPIYYLDLIKYRDISNKIASILTVEHESPQLIVVKNGETLLHRSHFAIEPKEVAKHI